MELQLALLSETFFGPGREERLALRLADARAAGARLVLLPELPLDPWVPVTREARDEDAEPPGGERQQALRAAARSAGVAVLGAAIVRDPEDGRRRNTSFLVDAEGEVVGRYEKTHLPFEEGFWETSHYVPGDEPPAVWSALGWSVGAQVCSDANRPATTQLLAALGAGLLLCPRATEPAGWPRWRIVYTANALTSAAYVATVNRPPEAGTPIGGPSALFAPDGTIAVETTEPLTVVELSGELVRRARASFPGYLAQRSGLLAKGFDAAPERPLPSE